MSTASAPNRDRFDDLLIMEAVYGLNPSELKEMNDLASEFEFSDDDRFDTTVAALDAGMGHTEAGEMPDALKRQILSSAESVLDSSEHRPNEEVSLTLNPQKRSNAWSARETFLTLVTVASLVIAIASVSGWLPLPTDKPGQIAELTLQEKRQALLSNAAANVTQVSWTNPTNDAASLNASGDVVWSDELQEGYMLIKGLDVNDPAIQQYQLWVFDRTRTDDHPVDGGVFDMAVTENGEVIIPIDAKIAVRDAKAFAVTIETPGGVVVSGRERLPLLAGNL